MVGDRARRAAACVLSVLVAAGCGTGPPAASPRASATVAVAVSPTPAAPTPSPTPKPAFWPLTGLPASDPATIRRRPLNVRLPNDRAARPQVGLSKADIVFEMVVEGGITRFSAIYQSQDPKAVGPVRSYRWSDLHITQMLRAALVASGATIQERDAVTSSIRAGNMLSVDAERVGGPYYRVAGRPGPNDLFVDMAAAREAVNAAGGAGPVDVPALAFLPSVQHEPNDGGFSSSTEARRLRIPFKEPVAFTYEAASQGYRRIQGGETTVDPDGNVPILARNVVVIHTDIWETPVVEDIFGSKGLDYRMTGTGAATIFRDGRRVEGTWKRDGVLDPFTFYDGSGQQVFLSPGQTWIQFLLPGDAVTSEPD